jgi:hypothetical protein
MGRGALRVVKDPGASDLKSWAQDGKYLMQTSRLDAHGYVTAVVSNGVSETGPESNSYKGDQDWRSRLEIKIQIMMQRQCTVLFESLSG